MMTCGRCHTSHARVDQVRACYDMTGTYLGPCTWLVEGHLPTGDPDEPYYPATVECGAPMYDRADGSGYDCTAGHSHTTAEARQSQGWDYCSDSDEALALVKAGTEPRTMTGQAWPW